MKMPFEQALRKDSLEKSEKSAKKHVTTPSGIFSLKFRSIHGPGKTATFLSRYLCIIWALRRADIFDCHARNS
jgi:hypothetical protein